MSFLKRLIARLRGASSARERPPERIELAMSVPPEVGEIAEIGPYRFSVNWRDTGRSLITYCNGCGGTMLRCGPLAKKFVLGISIQERPRVYECATCGAFQGYVKSAKRTDG